MICSDAAAMPIAPVVRLFGGGAAFFDDVARSSSMSCQLLLVGLGVQVGVIEIQDPVCHHPVDVSKVKPFAMIAGDIALSGNEICEHQ
ncbi:MAG: hypothetical protein ACRCR1_09005 [Aeromonas sp.]